MSEHPDIDLTDASIAAAMLRAETAVCPPGDARYYGFSNGVEPARAHRTPAGWCHIG
jgi:hypothetical protein